MFKADFPLTKAYPNLTPYQFAHDSPIYFIDLDGLEGEPGAERMIRQQLSTAISIKSGERVDKVYQKILEAEGDKTQYAGYAAMLPLLGIAAAEGGATWLLLRGATSIYQHPTALMEGTAMIAGVFYDGPEDLCPTCKGDEFIKVFKGKGRKILDFFGGKISKYDGALNIDEQAEKGYKGTIKEITQYLKKNDLLNKTDEIIADNPQDKFLIEASEILKKEGVLIVRGNKANNYFQDIFDGIADGIEKFEVVSKTYDVAKEGMKRTDGTSIQGKVNEIILKRKG